MKLLYLFVPSYGLLKNAEFNFSANEKFKYEDGKLTQILHKKKLSNDFFSAESEKHTIENISAIVGNNGAGKTTVFYILNEILSGNIDFEHILLFRMKNKLFYSQVTLPKNFASENDLDCFISDLSRLYKEINPEDKLHSSQKTIKNYFDKISTHYKINNGQEPLFFSLYHFALSKFNLQFKDISPDDNNITNINLHEANNKNWKIIYHSNYYNSVDNWNRMYTETINISTSYLVKTAYEKFINPTADKNSNTLYHQIDSYKNLDLLYQVRVITASKNIELGIILPAGILITSNLNDWQRLKAKIFAENNQNKKIKTTKNREQKLFVRTCRRFYSRLEKLDSDFRGVSDITGPNFFIQLTMAIWGNWLYNNFDYAKTWDWKNQKEINSAFALLYKILLDNSTAPRSLSKINPCISQILSNIFGNINRFKFIACNNNSNVTSDVPTEVFPQIKDICELVTLISKYYKYIINRSPYIPLNSTQKKNQLDDFHHILNLHDKIYKTTSFLNFEYYPAPSSGELALLSLYARFYNIIWETKKSSSNFADDLLILLDETEITMHPNLQRKLIWNLIKFFDTFFPGKKIQLIFATHSPIILSDIPIGNVSFLRRENDNRITVNPPDAIDQETFGANLCSLFRNSFFTNGCLFGEFAQKKIDDISTAIDKLSQDFKYDNFVSLREKIDMIGDLLIKKALTIKLEREYDESLSKDKFDEIEFLEKRLKIAKNKNLKKATQ